MGIQDFDSIFHILDPARRGVINAEQVKQIDATLHFTPLDDPQVMRVTTKQTLGFLSLSYQKKGGSARPSFGMTLTFREYNL